MGFQPWNPHLLVIFRHFSHEMPWKITWPARENWGYLMYAGSGHGGLALSGADQQWPGSFQVEGAGADVPSGTWGLLGDYYNYNSRENYQPTDPGLDTWRETIQFLGVGKTLPISKTWNE